MRVCPGVKVMITWSILESIALNSSFESATLVWRRKTPTPVASVASCAEMRTLLRGKFYVKGLDEENKKLTFCDTCSTLMPGQSFVLSATRWVPVVRKTHRDPNSEIQRVIVPLVRTGLLSKKAYLYLLHGRSCVEFRVPAPSRSASVCRTRVWTVRHDHSVNTLGSYLV